MHSVLFLAEVASDGDEGLNAKNTAGILVVLGQLSENGEQFLDKVLLFKLSGEVTELGGTNAPNHGGIFLAKLKELFAEAFFLGISTGVGVVEQVTGRDTASEPLVRAQADDEGAEGVLDLFVAEGLTDGNKGSGSLITDNSLVSLGQLLEERQESGLVGHEREDCAELLGDGEKDLVVLTVFISFSNNEL